MKKLFYVIFISSLLLSLTSTAFAQTLDLDLQVNEDVVTITGSTGASLNISVLVEREDGKRSYINQIKSAADGSFVHAFNLKEGEYTVYVAAENGASKSRDVTIETDSPSIPPTENEITVYVSIIGKSKTYFSGYVVLPKDKANALEALAAACSKAAISYKVRDNNLYVYEIAGEREDLSSTAGWKFLVNDVDLGRPAIQTRISDGDEVTWYWAESYMDTRPGINENLVLPPELTEEQKEAKEAARQETQAKLQIVRVELSAVFNDEIPETSFIEVGGQRVLVVGSDNIMCEEEREYLQLLFENNCVKERQEAKAEEDNVIKDEQGEVEVNIQAGALPEDTEITIEEKEDGPAVPNTHRRLGNIYDFGPDGLEFAKEVQVSLPLVYDSEADPQDIDPREIVLAWYDEKLEAWMAVPAVVDLTNGRVTGLLNHFSKVAVLVREREPISFNDFLPQQYPWAIREVSYLSALGVINGIGGEMFVPNQPVTRAQFTKMIVEVLDIPKSDMELDFSDVQKGKWYYTYLQQGVSAGIIQGNTDGTFAPDREVTRQEMAVIISRALKLTTAGEKIEFSDYQDIAPWAREAVDLAAGAGLLKGFDDGTYRPAETATRAQSAVVVYRLLETNSQNL